MRVASLLEGNLDFASVEYGTFTYLVRYHR